MSAVHETAAIPRPSSGRVNQGSAIHSLHDCFALGLGRALHWRNSSLQGKGKVYSNTNFAPILSTLGLLIQAGLSKTMSSSTQPPPTICLCSHRRLPSMLSVEISYTPQPRKPILGGASLYAWLLLLHKNTTHGQNTARGK
jgi:hypothetical protein